MAAEILGIVALILLNGLLAGAEIAVVAVRKGRLLELVEAGNLPAREVQKLRDDPESFFATVQIGITVVGATAAAFGGARLADALAPGLARLPWVGGYAEPIALALVIAAISYLSLVLGELVPKSLALRSAERYALAIGPPLRRLSRAARPIVRVMTWSSNLLLRLFGDRTTFTEARLSAAELRQLLDEAATTGSVDPRTSEIAGRALDLADLRAADVMVPRRMVVAVPRDASPERLLLLLRESGHARIPVYDAVLDQPLGYLPVREALAQAAGGSPVAIDSLLRPAHFVPESIPATDLLQQLRALRQPLAFVVDEHGGLAGIVTLEDLLEELVGDIASEHDQPVPAIERQADGSYLVQGTTPIREIDRDLDLRLAELADSLTIAGLCLELAGGIPRAGDQFRLEDGLVLQVAEASPRRVRRVRLVPATRPGAARESAPPAPRRGLPTVPGSRGRIHTAACATGSRRASCCSRSLWPPPRRRRRSVAARSTRR